MFLSFPHRINRALVLKLIDSGAVRNLEDLADYFVPKELPAGKRIHQIAVFRSINYGIFDEFVRLGLIESVEGRLHTTPRLKEVTYAIGISLTAIAQYTENSIHLQPVFGPPDASQVIKADVFVLMPFDIALRPVYEDHIAAICASLNLTVARADDVFAASVIVKDVWNAINNARIVVADCTKRNPNVFYEIGLAHTIGRPTILMAQSIEDIPFDLRHIRCLIYEYTPRGMASFGEAFRRTLQNESEKAMAGFQLRDDLEEDSA